MTEASAITDEIKALLNVEFGPKVYEIEKGMVRKFVEAIDDPNPLWQEVVPPTFPVALQLEEFSEAIFTVKCPLTRFLNAGSELEYYHPIKVGDTIYVTGRVTDVRERKGKTGRMLFMITELAYKNQSGEVMVKGRNTFIRY